MDAGDLAVVGGFAAYAAAIVGVGTVSWWSSDTRRRLHQERELGERQFWYDLGLARERDLAERARLDRERKTSTYR